MKKHIPKIIFFALVMISIGAIADQGWDSVSIIRLIANPKNYNDAQISVSGYLHHREDSSALYISKADADFSITQNAIAIIYGKKVAIVPIPEYENQQNLSLNHFDSKYVKVYGLFASKFVQGIEKHSGTLYDVSKIEEIHRRYSGKAVLKSHDN